MHIVIVSAVNTGIPPNITFGAVGIQGATVMGIHGAGVGTPKAAAVSAITIGLAGLVHIAKGTTFTIGAIAIILAPGIKSVSVIEMGRTISVDGAIPNEHIVRAPIDTVGPGILLSFFFIIVM
jgi:hypothetical protein